RLRFFFLRDTVITYIYTLFLHDALPIFTAETNKNRQIQSRYLLNAAYLRLKNLQVGYSLPTGFLKKYAISNVRVYFSGENLLLLDRKSTRLNSSHVKISYAVFCLKKKTI